MMWKPLHPQATADMLGLIPEFLQESDPQPAKEQLAGAPCSWRPLPGFEMIADGSLCYPGDPPLRPLLETKLRDETIRLYEFEWVAIIQADGSFEVARMD